MAFHEFAPKEASAKHETSTANFGLSKNLTIPISVKICYLQPNPASTPAQLVPNSQKYKNPAVFQTLSHISANSDLFVRIQVVDGHHNTLTPEVQTPYRPFSANKRIWNTYLKLPIHYSQVDYGAYLRVTVLEIVGTKSRVFGVGTISLFNHDNSTLRKGSFKVAIEKTPEEQLEESEKEPKSEVVYGELQDTSDMEAKLVRYENGEYPRSEWLDSWAMPAVDSARVAEPAKIQNPEAAHFLFLELPNFSLPVVYSDITYTRPEIEPISTLLDDVTQPGPASSAMIINSIDISSVSGEVCSVYDPDFHQQTILEFNSKDEQMAPPAAANAAPPPVLDPIEAKYQKLATNINNNSMLDRELKPSPQMRDELWRILNRPSSAVLSDHEKKLLWKFRFYFSKNSLADERGGPSQANRQFLTKFFKCFNWENEFELDHAFTEILPFWSVETIDIGDALELLSNNFNPQNISASLRRHLYTTAAAKDLNTSEEKKIDKIFDGCKKLRSFAVARLRLANADELLLYLLQLVQALKYEPISSRADALEEAPLARFLVERSVSNGLLGNFFYWYVKVENEDQLNLSDRTQSPNVDNIYNIVLNTYIEKLKDHSVATKSPQYKHLKRQIAFVKKLTGLVDLLRSTFKKNEATGKKVQFLQEYLADASNGFLKFDPFPLPLDPSVMICGCYPSECSVFKSSLAPLKITFKTVHPGSESTSLFGRNNKHGKYALMFKIGDDLRQDQLVIQIINLMDQLLKNENLNLKLTPYKILATSPIAGFIQFVPNETLDSVLSKNYDDAKSDPPPNGILSYLRLHSRMMEQEGPDEDSILGVKSNPIASGRQKQAIVTDLGVSSAVMDNYVKSCAGYCVITYILGVGDRHLDNLLLSPNGKFWHADFGYILGRDPKPFPPLMKLPIQVIDGMGGMNHENFNIFKSYCFITYTTLRRNSNLILNLFQLMLNANIPDIQIDPKRAVEKVQEKFAFDLTEEEAIIHFQNLIIDSVNAFLPVVIDTLHSLAQYWRA